VAGPAISSEKKAMASVIRKAFKRRHETESQRKLLRAAITIYRAL
jgi:hypothetical protein